jgi:hypothetical protein
MNKAIFVCITCLLLFTSVLESFSNPVNTETAKKVAQNFMNIRRNISNTVLDVVIEKREGQNSFYVVNFREGGWVMISADDSTVPILGYNFNGTYLIEDEKPDGFLYLVSGYRERVDVARRTRATRSNEIIEQWNKLITGEGRKNISQKSYTPSVQLLNVAGRGHVEWSQTKNNDGTCAPAYNAYAPSIDWTTLFPGQCDCDKMPVGCGAVAMGQVMWYWLWPKSSSYGSGPYNWDMMPATLLNGQTAQGDAIARLLRDCGYATNMTYACIGSFTTMNNIEEALRTDFDFNATSLVRKSDWSSSVWNDLIRTEIDCKRPVIYRGDKSDLSTQKHIFVIDGYDAADPNLFRFNFGWGEPGNWYNTGSVLSLGDITPEDYEYNKNQSAIIGISPTYHIPSNINITDISYTTIYGNRREEARQNIALPASGKNLTVENGGNLTLVAGNSITLKPGFHAKAGSQFTAKIDDSYSIGGEMEISVPGWPNAMSPERGGFWIWVNNANSYDITITRRSGHTIYQGAGIISGNRVDLWDGTGADPGDAVYVYRLRLRNNFGRIIDRTSDVTLIHTRIKSAGAIDTANINNDFMFSDHFTDNTPITDADVTVYPNPASGTVNISITKPFTAYSLKVYNAAGVLVYQDAEITGPAHSFDMSRFADGTYLLQMEIDRQPVLKKIILAR